MFEKFIKFFVENARMNYILFFLIVIVGTWSYMKIPKEIFPNFEPNIIIINGGYSGSSIDTLNKMVVTKIEDSLKDMEGIKDSYTKITPGSFRITLELNEGENKYNLLNKIKDTISSIKSDLPSDMREPRVNVIGRYKDLMGLVITSNKYTTNELKPFSTQLKSELLGIKGVSDVTIYGDSDKYFQIVLQNQKIDALNLDKRDVIKALSNLSYIFPIGSIDGDKNKFYISMDNNIKNHKKLENILLKIGNKSLYLKDISSIAKKYKDPSTLSSFNGKNRLSLSIQQAETADGIKVSKEIKEFLLKTNKGLKDINIMITRDNGKKINDRLNIIISNLFLGIILIAILVILLINVRLSAIIILGIPTSFLMATIYMYMFGYTINMMSLIGILISIGIVVDDAIVVSENIQQHLEEGYSPKEASIMGAKEMVKPVTIASITTLFSFLPILFISGTLGEFMKLIPIALSSLLVASLIESFIFLPIHAVHTLKSDSKVTSWEKANNIYSKILHFFMKWKKSFLTLFILLVPTLTFVIFMESKFQMFPRFDSSNINISIKANENTTLENSFSIAQKIEADLYKKKNDFFIKNITTVAGYRRDEGGSSERLPYVMYMKLNLQALKPMNFFDKYITPYLSFNYSKEGRTRSLKSKEIAKKLQQFLIKKDYKKQFNLNEILVLQRKAGPVKSDIQIDLSSKNAQQIIQTIQKLTKELKNIKGVTSASNSLKFGVDEIKIKINGYGKELGLTKSFVGSYLSNLYLEKKIGLFFDGKDMLDVKIKSFTKDSYENLKNIQIPLPNNKFVRLYEVAQFNIVKSFEKIQKYNGEENSYVYANVNTDIITSDEVLKKIEPTLEKIKKSGIKVTFGGAIKKKEEFQSDMLFATTIALILIMLSMLYLFNSFKDTFIVMSVIPFSILGVLLGHKLMGLNLSIPSMIGMLGLAGVVVNDGIIMMTYLKKAKNIEEIFYRAEKRFRPIILTTVTTLVGLSSLIFFPTKEAMLFQPIAISLGFGLAWGTILNLIYLPVLYKISHKI